MQMKAPAHTLQQVRAFLRLNRATGRIYWRVTRGKAVKGAEAGCPTSNGYLVVRLEGRLYMAHHLAWLLHTGVWPSCSLDHKNGVGTDNRKRNLREASQDLNMQNLRGPRSDNTTGFLGVSLYKPNGRYRASIFVGKRHISLGYYATPEEASVAYLQAKRKFHQGCTI